MPFNHEPVPDIAAVKGDAVEEQQEPASQKLEDDELSLSLGGPPIPENATVTQEELEKVGRHIRTVMTDAQRAEFVRAYIPNVATVLEKAFEMMDSLSEYFILDEQ